MRPHHRFLPGHRNRICHSLLDRTSFLLLCLLPKTMASLALPYVTCRFVASRCGALSWLGLPSLSFCSVALRLRCLAGGQPIRELRRGDVDGRLLRGGRRHKPQVRPSVEGPSQDQRQRETKKSQLSNPPAVIGTELMADTPRIIVVSRNSAVSRSISFRPVTPLCPISSLYPATCLCPVTWLCPGSVGGRARQGEDWLHDRVGERKPFDESNHQAGD